MAVGQEAVVPNAMEAIRQRVQQEAADELIGIEGHDLGFAVMTIVLPAEADTAINQADETRVGDRHTMRVAAEICEHLIGPAKGRLGVDYPLDPPQLGETPVEGSRLGKFGEIAEEAQFIGIERSLQVLQEQTAKEP